MTLNSDFSPVVRPFPGVEITMFRGEEDNAKVIQIDTTSDEHIRVNLNDAPVFDGSPERDSVVGVTLIQLADLAEKAYSAKADDHALPWYELNPESRRIMMNRMRTPLERVGINVEKEPS